MVTVGHHVPDATRRVSYQLILISEPLFSLHGPVLQYRTNYPTMSSPATRRMQRNSQSATPRRTTRSSQAIMTSPLAGAAPSDQLFSEASQNFDGPLTNGSPLHPTLQDQPPVSSPLFFRSSPANGSVANSAVNTTPRPSGITAGGKLVPSYIHAMSLS